MGLSGEEEILGQFKNMAAVIASPHSSPSMIQLSGRGAGFTAPPINRSPRSWRGSRRGYGVRTDSGSFLRRLAGASGAGETDGADASIRPTAASCSTQHQKLIVSPPPAITGMYEKQNARPD